MRLRAACTEPGSGKSSGVSGRSSGRWEKSWPPNRPDSRFRPTSGSDSSLVSRVMRSRLGFGRGDHRAQARQDQHLLGLAPLLRHEPLQIGVELLRGRLLHVRGEHRLGVPRGEPAPDVGRSGLHQHRPALRRARQVQRPGHLVVFALVVDRPDAVGLGVAPAGAVVEHGVLGPAVPQRLDHGHELFALGVAVGVADLPAAAEVARGRRQP